LADKARLFAAPAATGDALAEMVAADAPRANATATSDAAPARFKSVMMFSFQIQRIALRGYASRCHEKKRKWGENVPARTANVAVTA
jgi:hypothetical protein